MVKNIIMRFIYISILLWALPFACFAQESALWSQLEAWYELTGDQPEDIKNKCDSLLQHHQLTAHERTFVYYLLSDCYYFLNDMRASEVATAKALQIMPEDYDKSKQLLLYNAHGQNQFVLGQKKESIEVFKKGIVIAKEIADTLEMAFFYDNIANSYISLTENVTSLNYLDSAMTCYFALGDSTGMLSVLDKQAGNYKQNEDYAAAKSIYRSAYKLVPSTEPEWRDKLNIRMATSHRLADENDSIEIYLQRLNESELKTKSADLVLDMYSLKAFVNIANKDTLSAIANFDSCAYVASQIGNQFEYLQCAIQAEMSKPASPQNVKDLQSILENVDSMGMKRLARVGYDIIARKYTHLGNMDMAYKSLRKSVELSYNINRKSTHKQIAQLSVDYKLKEKEYQLQIAEEREKARTKQLVSYGVTFGSLGLLLLGFLQYRNRRTKHQLEKEKLEKEKTLIEEISNLESKAFRAQMNPHFIFNALNSIKGLVIQQKTEKAADYISDFSKLVRSILENSMSKSISLHDEIETLKRYIKLEQMRFQGNFEYQIVIEDQLDADNIMVPPILIQPFVENSIWHGFSDRKEANKLNVHIYSGHELHIVIVDNGVGRSKTKDKKVQKSHGVNITQQRIWNFSGDRSSKRLNYKDLVDDTGKSKGTQVEIVLPIKYRS